MPGPNGSQSIEAVVRGVATAAKTLRLYPPSSPIPRQSAEGAVEALRGYLSQQPVLALAVARDGFAASGEPVAPGMPGASDLAEMLRSHGVAEIDFLPGCGTEELLSFLGLLERPAEDVRASGGLSALLAAEGVESVRVTDVALTVADAAIAEEDAGSDDFLRRLATDPDKLAAWIAAAAHGDPAALADGLAEIRRSAGPEAGRLAESLASAFASLDRDGRDALLTVAMEDGEIRGLTGQALGMVRTDAIASALCGGMYGQNMLSLSGALTRLPLADRMKTVFGEVAAALEQYGKSAKEAEFLTHMVNVRGNPEPERPLAGQDAYRYVAERARASEDELGAARAAATDERAITSRGVNTLLMLLDQQTNFELFCGAADSLAGSVAKLLQQGDLELSVQVVRELAGRETLAKAFSSQAIRGLLETVATQPEKLPLAVELVRHAGDTAGERIAVEAVSLKEGGLAVAEQLIGRRLVDQLAALAPQIQWYQVGPVIKRLAGVQDHRALNALHALLRRPDEQSRREAAAGLGEAGAAGVPLLGKLLADPSMEVAIVAARALGRSRLGAAAVALGVRLGELDIDGKDFLLGRELISALARIPGPEAAAELKKVAARRTLIKRGHFAEVAQLAKQAIDVQQRAGGAA